MYRDYFETDIRENPDNEAALETQDEEVVRALDAYRTDQFDFQEMYTTNPIEDATSMESKLIFRFVNRRAVDSVSDYDRRQKRMVERSFDRLSNLRVVSGLP